MDSFLLKKLFVKHKGIIHCDIDFVTEEYSAVDALTTSVIIGSNGAGKSFLLMVIAEVFNFIDRVLESPKQIKRMRKSRLKYDHYKITYQIGFDTIVLAVDDSVELYVNNLPCLLDAKYLPKKVLGVSYMLNDKFTFKKTDNKIYQYLGVRQSSNASWTSSISSKVSDCFLKILTDDKLKQAAESITNFLDLDTTISFLVIPNAKQFFSIPITVSELKERVESFSGNYRNDKLLKLTDMDFEEIVEFLDFVRLENKYQMFGDITAFGFVVDASTDAKTKADVKKYYNIIKKLGDMKYIKTTTLFLVKKGEPFQFEYASSGEKHFIFETVNILANIHEKSLVLVDEPEISMHPNWQMKYISTLKKIFASFTTCHFIISTHSHFIVSDLESHTSSLVFLEYEPENKSRKSMLIPYSTYAWSAENILYNVFRVRTTRNWYFEQDINELINLIEEESKDKKRIEAIINKLESYFLSDTDPLRALIDEGKEYIALF